MEFIRTLILVIGWPILIVGSIYLIALAARFYQDVGRTVHGKLVLAMVVGWFVSMYSLGITATAYMFAEVESGVLIVLPIFFIWFITMLVISWTVLRWSKEAVTLSAFYRGLEELVKKRTAELEQSYHREIENEQELRRLRERFVFIAAHELRTPVTAMEWGLSTLLEDKEFQRTLPSDYRTLLEDLRAKNQKLLELVADLLNIARLQANAEGFETEAVSVKGIFAEAVEGVKRLAEREGVKIYSTAPKEPPQVLAHPLYLKEILTNLLVNAIRYNKRGGWIRMEAAVKPTKCVISVKDNGIGMDKKEMEGLFEEFYRVKNQQTSRIEGTGLGLFITKHLVERLGGKIWVESEKGKGSTFSFYLSIIARNKNGAQT